MADLSSFPITKTWPAKNPDIIQLYSLPTPNGVKVSIALEELGLPYEAHRIEFGPEGVKSADFISLNPNGRIPAIIDPNGPDGKPIGLFESGAILVYLAEKTGHLLPKSGEDRARVFEQLFFHASALSPAFGQAGFFQRLAAVPQPIAIDRFAKEARRIVTILNGLLSERRFVAGSEFSIADIAHYGWLWRREFAGIDLDDAPHVACWFAEIDARPAVQRAVTRSNGLAPSA